MAHVSKRITMIALFGFLRRFQHCTGHNTMGSFMGRGNQYIQLVKVLYCKLPTIGEQLPAFLSHRVLSLTRRPQRKEVNVYHCATVDPIKLGLGRVQKNGTEYSPSDNRPEFE